MSPANPTPGDFLLMVKLLIDRGANTKAKNKVPLGVTLRWPW